MKNYIKILIYCLLAFMSHNVMVAQNIGTGKYAIKAYANIGLGYVVKLNNPISGMDKESSANDYGVGFGWTFWQKQRNSMEFNVGISYGSISTKMGLTNLDYSYFAPEDADMDGNNYIRSYEISDLHQKITVHRLNIPIYVSYAYCCNQWLKIHAGLGLRFGFKISSKLSDLSGKGYSYGTYPQYDNLKIEANYLNDFGPKIYSKSLGLTPNVNNLFCDYLVGIGTELKIYGPFAADVSVRYSGGLTNLYKSNLEYAGEFDANNAPVTYTVKDGQRIKCLTDYIKSSKLSELSLNISFMYRF